MRHQNHSLRLAYKPHHADKVVRNLVTSVLLYEKIRTTKKRAEVIRPLIDKVITIGKTDRTDLAIRRINQIVTDTNACRKVLEVFKGRYAKRGGGFTRMKAVGLRKGDGAKMVDLILVDAVLAGDAPAPDAAPKKTAKKASSATK